MRNFFYYYLATFKNIIRHSSIFTTVIFSVIFYSFFYPTAYKAERPEALPIIIVDQEQSELTNQIITQVLQSPNVNVVKVTDNFLQAEQMVRNQKADAILLLPDQLSQSLRRAEVGGIGIYVSTAYFLKTKDIGLGIASAIESVIQERAARFGQITHFKLTLPIHQIPLFNVLSGYGSYIFPAVAPVIIHQTIILGLGMLIGGFREKKWQPSNSEFCGIFACFFTIGCLGCFYLFGFIFWFNDYPRGGNFWGMLLAVPIFVACITSMGLLFGSLLDMAERAGYILVFTSIPLFLLTGIAWPIQSMPVWIQMFTELLPSTHAVQMFVQLNQMGTPTYLILPKLLFLFIFAIVCLCLAYYRLVIKPDPR